MDYWTEPEDYLRLLAFHEDYVFSDFEALGVDVHLVVTRRWSETSYASWDVFHLFPQEEDRSEVLYDIWSDDGGVEYGYRTVDVVPPEIDLGDIPEDVASPAGADGGIAPARSDASVSGLPRAGEDGADPGAPDGGEPGSGEGAPLGAGPACATSGERLASEVASFVRLVVR
jgi:hypothetical protein